MVSMKKRTLTRAIEDLAFGSRKMAFVSGPRQCGKTTLAKMMLKARKAGVYRNWDEVTFRRAWAKDPSTVLPKSQGDAVGLLVLDEIHKDRRWKRNLKGIYDTMDTPCDILVTGSARLNVFFRGSDSLLGRHLSFRLHPFSTGELEARNPFEPDAALEALFDRGLRRTKTARRRLDLFMRFGPFPEPFLAQDLRQARLWRRNREQLIIREDLRDLSRLPELGRIEMLTSLLPERVGSLFSLAALGRELEVSIPTVKRWMEYMKGLYYAFEIKPYHRRVPRSLRRAGKVYLWDYASVQDSAARFENLVACHLLKACHFWTDTGEGDFDLMYLRDKEGREIDFLIVRDGRPWLPVEVKLSAEVPSRNWARFSSVLPCTRALQLVNKPVWDLRHFGQSTLLTADAAEGLRYFP
jgi:predicted AAA+ superfamily ATPase